MRVDSHQHFWRYEPDRHAWITPDMAAIRRDFLPADFVRVLGDAAFDGSIAVEAHASEAETEFLLALANESSLILGVVGWVDLFARDLDDRLARWRGAALLKGFRHAAQGEADDFLARDDLARAVTRLGVHNYAYDILVYPRQLVAAERLVAACPGVRFVLDHCAKPSIASGEIDAWRRDIERIARHPNVSCKMSGLVTEAAWTTWTEKDLEPYLETIMSTFGPERSMFGSDWPVCLVASDYARWVEIVQRFTERLSASERASVFGGTAAAVYRLEARNGA